VGKANAATVNRRVASSNLALGAILPLESESVTQHVTTTLCGCNRVQLRGFRLKVQSRSVLASLWSVDDASTANLMAAFYKLWTGPAKKLSKAEALRQTQLTMLGAPSSDEAETSEIATGAIRADNPPTSYGDPYYWAPFILMGNWK
jgi:hypothetical protein